MSQSTETNIYELVEYAEAVELEHLSPEQRAEYDAIKSAIEKVEAQQEAEWEAEMERAYLDDDRDFQHPQHMDDDEAQFLAEHPESMDILLGNVYDFDDDLPF